MWFLNAFCCYVHTLFSTQLIEKEKKVKTQQKNQKEKILKKAVEKTTKEQRFFG